MSAESRNPASRGAAVFEPAGDGAPVPVWLFVLLFVLLYVALAYFDRFSGWFNPTVYTPYASLAELQTFQPPSGAGNLDRGKAVYENVCALCHNPDGAGKPAQAPALAGSEWVLGSPERLIRIPLNGIAGPIEVKGEKWNLAMPAMGAALSDEDLAATLSYMRQSWGNKGSLITPQQVKAVRGEVGTRAQPWSAAELLKIQ